MAEGNNPSVPKKKRPTDRGPQFSFNIEVPRTQESRLLGIKDRIKMARGSLNLTKATTSTQNADLMEALLLAFEEKIERKRLTSSDLSLSLTGSPNSSLLSTPSTTARFSIPSASSTPSSRISLTFSDPFSPISLPQAERTPQRMQITASSAENDSIYLCSEESLRTLFSFFCNTLSTSCCYCGKPLDCESLVFDRQSHVVSVTISCVGGDSFKWLSSPIMGGSPPKYYVNLRLIHGVLSCGLAETQYTSFCQAANIGSEGEKTFDTVLKKLGYLTVVKRVSNELMLAAQEQVKSNPAYAVNGECVITDARHDSSRSAAYTTVSALSFSTKKVLAVVNWSKANETSAVSCEVPMTKELLTYLCETQGFHVAEVAHDFVLQLKTWILSKGMLNSFDSWHGAKSVTKAMKKVASGPQRDEGSKWFFELSDKVKSTRTHVYFCMKNSPPTEEEFQSTLLNVVDHYQVNNISFEVCGQDCSHTNSMVDQCSEQIHDGGYHTCYAAGYNLTIGKKEFASEKAYYCEGGQCNLKCNGIRCTQICKEGEDDLLISRGTSSSSTSPVAVSASTESAWTQPSPQPSLSSSPSPANEYVSKFDRIEIIINSSLQLTAEDETILQIITKVGLSFSITGILLTIIVYSFITDVRQPLSQIRLSFSVSLGAGQIIFLAGIKATENTASCVTAAVLSQYFLMAAFCWMMVEGVYLYLFARKVYNIGDKMHTYHIISWGTFISRFPVVMVGISLSVAAGKDGIQSYTSDKYCWLSSTNNLIWIFVAFVALIEVFNILIIIRVHKEMSTLMQPMVEDKRFQQIRLGMKTCVVMVPLLGVTWLFGLLLPLHKAFAYIFTLLNSTQGFMIFALHCMRNSQIRERFKRRMNAISPYAVDENFTKKGSHVNLGDAGNVWTVELQSFNN